MKPGEFSRNGISGEEKLLAETYLGLGVKHKGVSASFSQPIIDISKFTSTAKFRGVMCRISPGTYRMDSEIVRIRWRASCQWVCGVSRSFATSVADTVFGMGLGS